MIVRVSVVLNNCRWQSLMFWQLCTGLKKMLWLVPVKLSGQTYFCLDTACFWPDSYKYLLWHISIKLHFWSIRRVKDWSPKDLTGQRLLLTGHCLLTGCYFKPWCGIQLSEPKWVVSCQLTVLNSGYWSDRSIGQLTHDGIGCLSLIYTVSLDVIGNVDSRNKYTMNSKQKENSDHYKVCESIVADGIVG